MKGVTLCVLCAMVSSAVGGAVVWPGALPYSGAVVRSFVPAQVKSFGYSTSQYIGGVPHSYTVRYQPQLAYQVPFNTYTPFQGYNTYRPLLTAPYFPTSSIYYPSISPAAPFIPINSGAQQPATESPQQQPGDEDTSVVESADNSSSKQPEKPSSGEGNLPNLPQFPPMPTYPSFPQFPQLPQLPQPGFPSLPQSPPSSLPQIPQVPQIPGFPQSPSGSQPQIPNFPSIPQSPSQSPPTSFPSADNSNQGLNDEDTISIESA